MNTEVNVCLRPRAREVNVSRLSRARDGTHGPMGHRMERSTTVRPLAFLTNLDPTRRKAEMT